MRQKRLRVQRCHERTGMYWFNIMLSYLLSLYHFRFNELIKDIVLQLQTMVFRNTKPAPDARSIVAEAYFGRGGCGGVGDCGSRGNRGDRDESGWSMIEVYPGLFIGSRMDYETIVSGQEGWAIVHACRSYHRMAVGYRSGVSLKAIPITCWRTAKTA